MRSVLGIRDERKARKNKREERMSNTLRETDVKKRERRGKKEEKRKKRRGALEKCEIKGKGETTC